MKEKQAIKKLILEKFSLNYVEILEKIKEFSVISFDMFDTLVTRNVMYPTDIFTYVERLYRIKFGDLSFDFKRARIEAENRARQEVNREVTLTEIYVVLNEMTGKNCDSYMQVEKYCEILFMEPRKEVKRIYEECIRQKKKVYIISDMYMDKEIITEILYKCGYSEWTKLYISSDIGTTKRTGELFRFFLDKEKLSPHDVVHIGDSIRSDYLMPKRYHLKSILLENKRATSLFDKKNSIGLNQQEWVDYTMLETFSMNHLSKIDGFPYVVGYNVLGPILYAFSKWLDKIVQNEKPDCIVFMAREGMTLKRAYEQISSQKSMKIKYLRTSRRSVAYPKLIKAETIADLLKIMPVKRNEDLSGLLSLLRLDDKVVWNKLEKLGCNTEMPVEDISQKAFDILKDYICEKALLQEKYLKQYLEQNDINGNILIVDIGWRGTTQHFLSEFCDEIIPEKKIRIKGCYVGVLPDNKQKTFAKDLKYGYWFDQFHDEELGDLVAISRLACELLFMHNEGSTTHYTEANNEIIPNMDAIEFSDEDIRSIQTVQNAAIDFINEFQNSEIKDIVNITPKLTLAKYFKFGIRPNKESLVFIDTFHYTESGKVYSYKAKHFWHYLTNPNKLKIDFSNTAWKTGFMRECFGMDLPYYKFLIKLRRMDQRRSLRKV